MTSHVDDGGVTLTPAVSVLHVMLAMVALSHGVRLRVHVHEQDPLARPARRAATLTLVVVFPAAALLHSHGGGFFAA